MIIKYLDPWGLRAYIDGSLNGRFFRVQVSPICRSLLHEDPRAPELNPTEPAEPRSPHL